MKTILRISNIAWAFKRAFIAGLIVVPISSVAAPLAWQADDIIWEAIYLMIIVMPIIYLYVVGPLSIIMSWQVPKMSALIRGLVAASCYLLIVFFAHFVLRLWHRAPDWTDKDFLAMLFVGLPIIYLFYCRPLQSAHSLWVGMYLALIFVTYWLLSRQHILGFFELLFLLAPAIFVAFVWIVELGANYVKINEGNKG